MKIINPSFLKHIFPWIFWEKREGAEKEVYITFDDGPDPKYTPEVLLLLKKYNIKASFFLIGEKLIQYPLIVKQIQQAGHTIGNHSFSHKSMKFCSKDRIIKEILDTDNLIQKITHAKPVYFRPPYGRFDPRFKKILQQNGYSMIMWSLLSYDFSADTSEKITKHIIRHIKPGAIIVFHDGHENSHLMIKALPEIFSWINANNLKTCSINKLV